MYIMSNHDTRYIVVFICYVGALPDCAEYTRAVLLASFVNLNQLRNAVRNAAEFGGHIE